MELKIGQKVTLNCDEAMKEQFGLTDDTAAGEITGIKDDGMYSIKCDNGKEIECKKEAITPAA